MITIITLGKVKEKHLSVVIDEYIQRIRKWTKVEVLELKDEKLETYSVHEQLKKAEAERALNALDKRSGYIIALDDTGKQYTSEEFATLIKKKELEGNMIFIMGGTIGLHESVIKKAHLCLSFGKTTFTRDIARLLLAEQLFRAYKINKGEAYQK